MLLQGVDGTVLVAPGSRVFPNQHSLPYSTPAYEYPVAAAKHNSIVIESFAYRFDNARIDGGSA